MVSFFLWFHTFFCSYLDYLANNILCGNKKNIPVDSDGYLACSKYIFNPIVEWCPSRIPMMIIIIWWCWCIVVNLNNRLSFTTKKKYQINVQIQILSFKTKSIFCRRSSDRIKQKTRIYYFYLFPSWNSTWVEIE